MEENELALFDRIEKIKAINEQYNLIDNAYISFSGGKDSTVLHYLIDLALPNNNIPRVFANTGIEYNLIVDFVKEMANKDNRFQIIKPTQNIKKMLEQYGYPFKSKEHSHILSCYQNSGEKKSVKKYLKEIEGNRIIVCPNKLRYQFTEKFEMKVSDKCCYKLKKEPFAKWCIENGKYITITGMQKSEGGQRKNISCIVTNKDNTLKKFHPLSVVDDIWENWFIDKYNIKLCELYYPPFNFERTGCKGCPYALNIQKNLDTMFDLLPNERKQCEIIWKPVYEEMRRIGYRLRKQDGQMTLWDE